MTVRMFNERIWLRLRIKRMLEFVMFLFYLTLNELSCYLKTRNNNKKLSMILLFSFLITMGSIHDNLIKN